MNMLVTVLTTTLGLMLATTDTTVTFGVIERDLTGDGIPEVLTLKIPEVIARDVAASDPSRARQTWTEMDRLWLAIATIQPLPAFQKFHKSPKTVQEAHDIALRLASNAGAIWWTLCTTGMGPKEYFEDGWTVQQDRIVIRGKKWKGRDRVVPRIATPVRPTKLTRWGFRKAFRRLDISVTPYDDRHLRQLARSSAHPPASVA